MSRAKREFLREVKAIRYRADGEVRHYEGTLRVDPTSETAAANRKAAAERASVWALISEVAEGVTGDDFASGFAAALRGPS